MGAAIEDLLIICHSPIRRRMLAALDERGWSVEDLAAEFDSTSVQVSKQLRTLRVPGLVEYEADERRRIYRTTALGRRVLQALVMMSEKG